jgi:hypothetical protein
MNIYKKEIAISGLSGRITIRDQGEADFDGKPV